MEYHASLLWYCTLILLVGYYNCFLISFGDILSPGFCSIASHSFYSHQPACRTIGITVMALEHLSQMANCVTLTIVRYQNYDCLSFAVPMQLLFTYDIRLIISVDDI